MEKFLLFTTGGGSADILNWASDEAAMYAVKDLESIKPTSARTLDLFFNTAGGREVVILKIKNSTHSRVMEAIANAINGSQAVISVADVDSGRFINPDVYGVTIRAQETYIQSLADSSRTKINVTRSNYSSCVIANTHSSAVTCGLELYDGSTYTYIIKGVEIEEGSSLVLEKDEISFDDTTYDLYATSNNGSGLLTLTFNY